MKARVRLRNPEYHDTDDFMHVDAKSLDWHEVDFLAEHSCGHDDSMCDGCIESWNNDYEVRF